jgi:hypothetical protein
MNERPKTFSELANELLLRSNPPEAMKEKVKDNLSPLADLMEKITTRNA